MILSSPNGTNSRKICGARFFLLLTIACSSINCGGGGELGGTDRPDVVLIVVDTLRADRLGCYGYERPTSPVIDSCAEGGVLFEKVIAQSSWTLPSMASMLTGEYITAYQDWVAPDSTTIAETFQNSGYQTLAIVSNHLLTEEAGYARGFEIYDNTEAEKALKKGSKRRSVEDIVRDLNSLLERELPTEPSRPPLFLMIHLMDVHTPFHEHEEFAELLPGNSIDGTEFATFMRERIQVQIDERKNEKPNAIKAVLRRIEADRTNYEREVKFVDRGIGTLLDTLAKHGVGEESIKVLVADHGEGLYEQPALITREEASKGKVRDVLQRGHGLQLFENLITTPLIIWGGSIPHGIRVAQPVENVDLFSTLLELCDLGLPSGIHGESLVPLMRGESNAPEASPVFSFVRNQRSVYDPGTGLKYIEPTSEGRRRGGVNRLHDLRTDPLERVNLAESNPVELQRMQARLEQWAAEHPAREDTKREWTESGLEALRALGYTDSQVGEQEN